MSGYEGIILASRPGGGGNEAEVVYKRKRKTLVNDLTNGGVEPCVEPYVERVVKLDHDGAKRKNMQSMYQNIYWR
ncbi:hypothetical protein JOB18_031497 [Solea senegalensis]|uniref:Uncharacterized protein n=1 Tax=Solea senegalensis TaxID=28829 RepID=A0AAV6PNR8_SOLSE|nr:hypothetical protein JOB18_031497 [Solea senegalensis]